MVKIIKKTKYLKWDYIKNTIYLINIIKNTSKLK